MIPLRRWWAGTSLVGRFTAVGLLLTVVLGLLVGKATASAIRITALDEEAQRVATIVAGRLGGLLRPEVLQGSLSPDRYAEIDRSIRGRTADTSTLAVNLWRADGTVIYSTDHASVGRHEADDDELAKALTGATARSIEPAGRADTVLRGAAGQDPVMEIYVPLMFGGSRAAGAFEAYRDLHDVDARIGAVERAMAIALGTGLAVLLALLLLVVRGASRQLRTQSDDLARLAARQEIDRRQTEFVGIVSHELRTPLTALLGFSELLLTRDVPDADRREWTALLHSGAQRLRHLVEQLLDVSRLDEGRLELRPARVPVAEAVQEALESFAALPPAYRIEQSYRGEPLEAVADRDKLVQVLTNLVSNAVKYSPDGGLVRVDGRPQGSTVRISVTDEGLGIPPEEMATIFDRFHRVDDERRRTIEGAGLGLNITRQLVEMQGGRIDVYSLGPRRGSTFTVVLPAAADEAGEEEAEDDAHG